MVTQSFAYIESYEGRYDDKAPFGNTLANREIEELIL